MKYLKLFENFGGDLILTNLTDICLDLTSEEKDKIQVDLLEKWNDEMEQMWSDLIKKTKSDNIRDSLKELIMIYKLFPNYRSFVNSLDHDYLLDNGLIDKYTLVDALEEAHWPNKKAGELKGIVEETLKKLEEMNQEPGEEPGEAPSLTGGEEDDEPRQRPF